MFDTPVSSEDIRRLKALQTGALLAVFLLLIFFLFTENLFILTLFFLLLIIGVLIPWIQREIISSHLILQKQIEDLKNNDPECKNP